MNIHALFSYRRQFRSYNKVVKDVTGGSDSQIEILVTDRAAFIVCHLVVDIIRKGFSPVLPPEPPLTRWGK